MIATARRLLLDPVEVGPIRLLGVGFSGLSDVRQESLFPELEQQEAELSDTRVPVPAPEPDAGGRRVGDDVTHPELGHGWIQGAGHGVMTVRFEIPRHGTRAGADVPRRRPRCAQRQPRRQPGLAATTWVRRSPEPGDDVVDG